MYETLFNIAQNVAQQQLHSGVYVGPDDTVCVVCSAGNRIYTGVSRTEVQGGTQTNIHAEIDAMQHLQQAGETAVTGLLLIKTYSRSPILPCNGCIRYILSLHPENARCQIVLPDRMMPITEIGQPAAGASAHSMYPQGMSMPFQAATGMQGSVSGSMPFQGAAPAAGPVVVSTSMPYQAASPVSGYGQSQTSQNGAGRYVGTPMTKSKDSNASYLKNRVGNLMNAADEVDDEDDEPENKTFFGRLFRK